MKEIVKTKNGEVKGTICDGILQFRGIPYAKPPVGALRFCLPEAKEPWDGVYDAEKRGAIAPQRTSDLDLPMGPVLLPRSEDCLTLSISTPSVDEKLPVAVWLHGGANCYGGGDLEWYDGGKLAQKGHIVVVNVNFRLGPFGFFQYPGISEHTLSVEDQMLALRWIQTNIGAFGGDPDKVTLFGQSAGANAIVHILSRPDSGGLFRQIILESPSLGRGHHLQKDAFEVGKNLMRKLGILECETDALKEKLQAHSVDEILDAVEQIDTELLEKHQGMVFKPVMDAWHTPEETIQAAVKAAREKNVRIVIGTTKEEMYAFLPGRDEQTVKKAAVIQKMRYDLPAQKFACLAAENGCSIWKYRFDWRAPKSRFGACHCLELPFVFGNLDSWDAPMLDGASREEMEKLVAVMQKAWCGFFRFEIPDETVWPQYTEEQRRIKCFDNEKNPVIEEPDLEMDYAKESLKLHERLRGKIEVVATAPVRNREDLSLAYTPGVAQPCLEIQKDISRSYDLTRRHNMCLVVTDGSAVLGLGDIGPEAGMPVMEGKCVLFKSFGDVDAFPLCIKSKDVDTIVETIYQISGSFGGINLEDISAPRCFEIERKLKERCDIPIFHDDQHGTAVITLAGLMNALKVAGKKIEEVQVVVNGAGAAAIAISRLLLSRGVRHMILCDRRGAIYEGRTEGMNKVKEEMAGLTNREKKRGSLADVLKGADVFIGVSAPGAVTTEMVRSMNRDAIVFACANPTPEIFPEDAKAGGAAVVATGRSDYPNQINNVLAFPGIFRGTFDVRAREINDEMKFAAAEALASLITAEELSADYIIPAAFDERVGKTVAKAVAEAARRSGVVRI